MLVDELGRLDGAAEGSDQIGGASGLAHVCGELPLSGDARDRNRIST
jgi:hypothetical protein